MVQVQEEEQQQVQQQGWADLPDDLLNLIFQRLTDLADLHQCRHVCGLWDSAATRIISGVTTPLLYLPKHGGGGEQVQEIQEQEQAELVSEYCTKPSAAKVYTFALPNALTQTKSLVSHHGWLLLSDLENPAKVVLYSPTLRETVKLPQMPQRDCLYPLRFVTSSAPTDPNCIVLACYFHNCRFVFGFCKPGDEKWMSIPACGKEIVVHDMIFYKGDFYAIDMHGVLLRFKLGKVPCVEEVLARTRDFLCSSIARYLVESPSRELVMVVRWVSGSEGTGLIQVFKMNWGEGNWESVHKLGDREAIFLAYCDSMFISTDDYMSNCVYFFDDHWGDYNSGTQDFGVYNMENETIKQLVSSSFKNVDALFYRWFSRGL